MPPRITTTPLPPDCDHTTEANYIAFRVGKHVQNCIFRYWEDAKVHIEGYDQAIYKEFERIEDADQYVLGQLGTTNNTSYNRCANGGVVVDEKASSEKQNMDKDNSSDTTLDNDDVEILSKIPSKNGAESKTDSLHKSGSTTTTDATDGKDEDDDIVIESASENKQQRKDEIGTSISSSAKSKARNYVKMKSTKEVEASASKESKEEEEGISANTAAAVATTRTRTRTTLNTPLSKPEEMDCTIDENAIGEDSLDDMPVIDLHDSEDKTTTTESTTNKSIDNSKEEVAMTLIGLQSKREITKASPENDGGKSKRDTKVIDVLESRKNNDTSQSNKSSTTATASKDESSLITATSIDIDKNTPAAVPVRQSGKSKENSSKVKATSQGINLHPKQKEKEKPLKKMKDTSLKSPSLASGRSKVGKKAGLSKKRLIELDDENCTPVHFDLPSRKKMKVSSTPKETTTTTTTTTQESRKPQSLEEALKANEASLKVASVNNRAPQQVMNMNMLNNHYTGMASNPYSIAPSYSVNCTNTQTPPNLYTLAQAHAPPNFANPYMPMQQNVPLIFNTNHAPATKAATSSTLGSTSKTPIEISPDDQLVSSKSSAPSHHNKIATINRNYPYVANATVPLIIPKPNTQATNAAMKEPPQLKPIVKARELPESWISKFKNLQEYKLKHGHYHIPTSDKQNEPLRAWVVKQKLHIKKHKGGDFNQLTEMKLNKFEEIGFDIGCYSWDERMEQLGTYKKVTGGLDIPRSHALLGKWFYSIRIKLEQYVKKNDTSKLSEEQAKHLLEMGITGIKESMQKSEKKLEEEKRKKEALIKKRDEEWLETFNELKEYQKIVGRHFVKKEDNKKLFTWVNKQRDEYKKLEQGKSEYLDLSKIRKLNTIGFQFAPRSGNIQWDERLKQFKAFKEKHGHLKIPFADPLLGKVAQKMRFEHKKKTDGLRVPETMAERLRILDEMGMVWVNGPKPRYNREVKTWDERFEELKEFKAKNGHTVVPQKIRGLGQWTKKQRCMYRKLKEGKKSRLTPEQCLKLVEIGFCFDASEYRGKHDKFAELAPNAAADDDDNDDSEDETSSYEEAQRMLR